MEAKKIKEKSTYPELNPHQEKAVRAPHDRPLLIVAGAGTGKTKTLTTRLARFVEEGVPGDKILAITFTNKAAKEMAERAETLVPMNPRPFIGTFHSLGAHILRKHAPLLGRSHNFAIFDDHDSFSLLKKVMKAMDLKKESPALFADAISAVKNGQALSELKPKALEVFQAYENALQRNDGFDFDDLLTKTVLLLKKHPHILERYHERWTHILVDEYQDLNDTQYELIRLLASPEANSGQRASLSVVGDAEQTIYGWRGSNIGIFLSFPEHWPGSEMVTLSQNYRSTKHILGAASGVIRENVYDTKIERATDLRTDNPEGDKVLIHEAADEEDEAFWIAERVLSARRRGSEESDPGAEAEISNESAAILYRTNAQSRALEQALLRRRIPYRVFGGLKFYERREIKDVVAGLRIALNPNDEVSKDRIEKQFSKRLYRALSEAFAGIEERKPLALIGAFLKIADYFAYMDRNLTNPAERRENIEELLRFAAGYEDLPKFLEEIALLQATDNIKDKMGGDEKALVTLTTIHLAKGLEFDRVFVAGANEGLLPHARSFSTKEELQEERRLMYVAMTRARKELFLSFYGIPSRFLGEIPEEHASFETSGGRDDFSDEFQDYEERYISLD